MKTTRREFLGMAGFAVGSAALFAATGKIPALAGTAEITRPPGVVSEEEFLQRCLRCRQCIYVCQLNTKQEENPSADVLVAVPLNKGFTLVNTPEKLDKNAKTGVGCTSCGRCRDACPSGAIPAEGGVAQIIATLCVGCYQCAETGVCPENAITKDEINRWPVIAHDLCTGCGTCITKCATDGQADATAIKLVAKNAATNMTGKNPNVKVAQAIRNSCYGCGKCTEEGVCEEDAIKKVEGKGYPQIDFEACIGCGKCIDKCNLDGTTLTKPGLELVKKANAVNYNDSRTVNGLEAQVLREKCAMCFKCTEAGVCPENAITRDPDLDFPQVDYDKCTGCGKCIDKCNADGTAIVKPAIELVQRGLGENLDDSTGGNVAQVIPKSGTSGCQQCNTPLKECFNACTYGAITATALGQYPIINLDKCIGCGDCVRDCIEKAKKNGMRLIRKSELE